MERTTFDQSDVDDREFGPEHDACRECGACRCEDCDEAHYVGCSYHPDFWNRTGHEGAEAQDEAE